MATLHIVPLYAAVLALMFVALSVRTLRLRRRLGIPVGDGGNETMLRAMRAHGNFAEYVPFSLILVFFLESGGTPALPLHCLCACLLAGRVSHAYGVSQPRENYRFRVLGTALTFTAIAVAAVLLLFAGQAQD